MKHSPVILLSRYSGHRNGGIASGVMEACATHGLPFLWWDFSYFLENSGRIFPYGLVLSGDRKTVQDLLKRVPPKVPIVSTAASLFDLPLPTVAIDEAAVAASLWAHFVEEGVKSVIHVGFKEHAASRERNKRLRLLARNSKPAVELHCFLVRANELFWGSNLESGRRFIALLNGCPKPVGIIAQTDDIANNCLECAQLAGLHVPRDVIVAGTDDHQVFTNMHLPLTSYHVDFKLMGQVAVELLQELHTLPDRKKQIPPRRLVSGHLVVRHSSRRKLTFDPKISVVLEFIEAHLREPIKLTMLARMAGISSSHFSYRFKQSLGCPATQYLIERRIEKAKALLADRSLRISEITYASGFHSPAYFSKVFRTRTGRSPSSFRKASAVA